MAWTRCENGDGEAGATLGRMIRMPYDKWLRAGLAFWAGIALAACSQATPPSEKAQVAAKADAKEQSAALPASIVRALGTDERVLDCAQGTQDGVSRFQPDWVEARRIDLNADGREDWILRGRHACLRDGDAPYWWVYADEAAGQRLILSGISAEDLRSAATSTQGFRDLDLRGSGGDVAARYDGKAYALSVPATATDASSADSPSQIDTVAGALEIAELPRGAHGAETFAIRLAGKELRRTGEGGDFADFPAPRILQRYRQGIAPFDEAIVFQQDMRGNACDGGPLWILGLKRDGSHAISDPIDFCGGKAPQLSATREELKIVLPGGPLNRGEGEIPTEIWRYRDGKATRDPAP